LTLSFETSPQASPDKRVRNGAASAEGIKPEQKPRLTSIDLLRGLVMIVMALDHTRDFFSAGGFNPRDVADPALFMTRWITHFCAPIFIFLAGISAFLYGAQGCNTSAVSRYLLTRGFWLVLLEFTVLRLGWTFSLNATYFVAQVIFAIGASMIALAALVYLPRGAIALIGLAMILGHNAFDGVKPEAFGGWAPVWNLLHQPGLITPGIPIKLYVLYPLIPWIGVMAVGFALGPVFLLERAARQRRLTGLGVATIAAFVVLRATNFYGDPMPWVAHDSLSATVLAFINCEKYPPSLLYLAMTLGPALLLLAVFDGVRGRLVDVVTIYGRVPLFYYVAHIFLIHALAVLFSWLTIGDGAWLFRPFPAGRPAGYGLGLPGIYLVWIGVVAALYPLCRWFATFKRRRREWWWTYL
jgi:uncharacterized membrane protein